MLYIGCFTFSNTKKPSHSTFNLLVDAASVQEAASLFGAQFPKLRTLSSIFSPDDEGTIVVETILEVTEPPREPILVNYKIMMDDAPDNLSLYCGVPDLQAKGVHSYFQDLNEEDDAYKEMTTFYEVLPIAPPSGRTPKAKGPGTVARKRRK